jgi:hypothetical protein
MLRVAGVFRQFVSSQTHLPRVVRYPPWRHAHPDFAALPHTTKTECRPQAIARYNRDEFRRISRVNAIVIDHHYQNISAASRQFFLNSLKSSEITEKAQTMCRIHDARPAIAKRRNTK